jgi:hypothetical protein
MAANRSGRRVRSVRSLVRVFPVRRSRHPASTGATVGDMVRTKTIRALIDIDPRARDELLDHGPSVAAYEGSRLVGLAPLFARHDAVRDQVRKETRVVLSEIPRTSPLARHLEREALGPRSTGLHLGFTTSCPRLRLRDNEEGVRAILRKESIRRHFKKLASVGPLAAGGVVVSVVRAGEHVVPSSACRRFLFPVRSVSRHPTGRASRGSSA